MKILEVNTMRYLMSTIGKKQMVGVAGLGLSLFVLVHMSGNLLIFAGPEAFNKYAYALTSNPLIYVAEAGLVTIFLLHLVVALVLAFYNKIAKKQKYAVAAKKTKASYASKTLHYQGVIIFAFLIWHLISFKYGPHYDVTYDGVEMRDLFTLVIEYFQNPLNVAAYVFVLFLLGMHLSHGLASSFQTLGLNGEKSDPIIQKIGKAYALIVTVGFISQPVYVYFVH